MSEITEEKIIEAMQRTWDYIADDTINALGGSVKRDVVIELVADRVEQFDKEAMQALLKMSWEDIKKIGRKAFPAPTHGY